MTWPDTVNGILEACSALFVMLNVRRLLIDRQVKGISWVAVVFFTAWGGWNLFYYPHLGQWLSFVGGIAVVAANAVWLAILLYLTFLKPWPGLKNTEKRRDK